MTDVPTLSGNEITDVTRRNNTQGDGLLPEQGSTGIWEATTNLCTNGGFETDAGGWGSGVNLTLTRVTDNYFFGRACAKIATLAGAGNRYININPAPTIDQSQAVTMSFWAKADPTSERPAPRLRVSFNNELQPAAIPITREWARYSFVAPGGSMTTSTPEIYITDDDDGSEVNVFYLDGIQFEQQPLATPYVETNGATATRAVSRARAPASALDETQGWVAMRVRIPWANTDEPYADPRFFTWEDDVNNSIRVAFSTGADVLFLRRFGGGVGSQRSVAASWAAGAIKTFIAYWNATTLFVSVDGSSFGAGQAAATIPVLTATTADIGSSAGSTGHIDADVAWFAVGSGTLTDADANLISRFNNDPKIADFPGTPTWFWDSGPDGSQVPLVLGQLGTGRI